MAYSPVAVFIAYVDESGDGGEGGSRTYALGCVMVDHDSWFNVFDRVIGFRRHLRRLFGIPVREEMKANYLLRNGGPYLSHNPLSESARYAIYRQFMRLHPKLDLKTFAVVIDKSSLSADQLSRGADEIAWEWLLQRLERRCHYEGRHVLLVHDEGDETSVRGSARKARRAGTAGSRFGTGLLRVPFRRLLDDPVPRNSSQSYFLQMADLAAYAAFRRLVPPPARTVPICPQHMWDELGASRFRAVTTGAVPYGIVHN